MGFKCPVCKKDFENDKSEWQKHTEQCQEGAAKSIVEYVGKLSKEIKKSK